MITLKDAANRIGDAVIYRPRPGHVEQGYISSVGLRYVFVRYGGNRQAQATHPRDLDFGGAVVEGEAL